MVYLLIGQDSPSKDNQLKRLKQEFLSRETEQFNLDVLYAKELALQALQERLLSLPLRSLKRIVVIKEAQELRLEVKEFILRYVKNPQKQIILVLDLEPKARSDDFINQLSRYAKTFSFRETRRLDAFALGRQIEMKRPDYALRLLNQLLKEGERPERILGGLRYAWEKDTTHSLQARKKLRLLLNCDLEIKTGKLKPGFALEKLVVKLCGLGKPFV